MAIAFIFFISIVLWILLAASFIMRSYPLGAISSMGIMVIGVHILISGVENIMSTLTIFLGVSFVCIGAYIFINANIEKIEEVM